MNEIVLLLFNKSFTVFYEQCIHKGDIEYNLYNAVRYKVIWLFLKASFCQSQYKQTLSARNVKVIAKSYGNITNGNEATSSQ